MDAVMWYQCSEPDCGWFGPGHEIDRSRSHLLFADEIGWCPECEHAIRVKDRVKAFQGSRADPRLGPTQNVLRDLPKGKGARKDLPIATGVIDYFPLALAEVARLSKAGNDQHNPGQPLHWAREKSRDHADCLMRHFIQRGTLDTDGISHTAKVAWRALAMLQEEMEARAGFDPTAGGS